MVLGSARERHDYFSGAVGFDAFECQCDRYDAVAGGDSGLARVHDHFIACLRPDERVATFGCDRGLDQALQRSLLDGSRSHDVAWLDDWQRRPGKYVRARALHFGQQSAAPGCAGVFSGGRRRRYRIGHVCVPHVSLKAMFPSAQVPVID